MAIVYYSYHIIIHMASLYSVVSKQGFFFDHIIWLSYIGFFLTGFHTTSGHNLYMYWPSLYLNYHCLIYNLFSFDFNLRSIEYLIPPNLSRAGFFLPLQCIFRPTPAWLHPSYIYKGINVYCIVMHMASLFSIQI